MARNDWRGILGGIPGSHTCNNAKELLHKHGHWAAVKYNAWVLNWKLWYVLMTFGRKKLCSSNYYARDSRDSRDYYSTSRDWKIDSVIPLRFHLFRCGQISTIFSEGEMSIRLRDLSSPTHVSGANQILSVLNFILTYLIGEILFPS